MESESEVTAEYFNDIASNISFSDSDDSSNSANFVRLWPETHAFTYQFLRDAELDRKKYQLERQANELQGSILDREIELQGEIREVNSEIGELRLQISEHELTLSEMKERKMSELLRIREQMVAQCQEHQAALNEGIPMIEKLTHAIEVQRIAHEREIDAVQSENVVENQRLDSIISQLNAEIAEVRRKMGEAQQKGGRGQNDMDITMDMLANEIRAVQVDSDQLTRQFEKVSDNLIDLKREMIIAEETSFCLRTLLQNHNKYRYQMKAVLNRGSQQIWEATTKTFVTIP